MLGGDNGIKHGDPSAFDRLYVLLAPRVLAYLLRLTGGNRSDAEDLTQETFLAAYRARADFAGNNPVAWLFGIARRRERDAFRAASVRPKTVAGNTEAEAATADPSETAPHRVVLSDALDRLPDSDRDALLLVVVHGMTYAETAAITGEPVGTVKWRVHAATKRLRALLSGTFAEYAAPEAVTRKETAHAEIT